MKRSTVFVCALISVVSLTVPSYAITNSGRNAPSSDRMAGIKTASTATPGSDLRGLKVVNQEGVVIGNIQDINRDSQTGRIDSVTFKDSGVKNYGLAPAWDKKCD